MIVPQSQIDCLSPMGGKLFRQWARFMYDRVRFNMGDSIIHGTGHCERVLLYSLILGERIFGTDSPSLIPLAHAAVFHDTRRQDDYLDTGHGARAAVYYRQFCTENPDLTFYPESEYMMRYHDIDDGKGRKAIIEKFGPDEVERTLRLYDIFKDADALDRWRLGSRGLDPRFLRTPEARSLVGFARETVIKTMPADILREIEAEVNQALDRNEKQGTSDN